MSTGGWFYEEPFSPRLKPREFIQVADEYYEVVETRPMFPWELKLTNITAEVDVDLKEKGLKALKDELLNVRLRIQGPVQVLFRVEGAGGPIFGGWGAAERWADERTPPHLIEFLVLGETKGWLYAKVRPITVPAWLKLTAYGYVYVVRKTSARPSVYAIPAYIASTG